MKYRLDYDDGKISIEASNDGEAQSKAREFLSVNLLVPQRRKNYLFRLTFYKKDWNVPRAFWRWVEIPFCFNGRVRTGW